MINKQDETIKKLSREITVKLSNLMRTKSKSNRTESNRIETKSIESKRTESNRIENQKKFPYA